MVNTVVLFHGEHSSDHRTSSQGVYLTTQSKFSVSCLSINIKYSIIPYTYKLHTVHAGGSCEWANKVIILQLLLY